jgi:hypothetical protein
MGTVKTQVIPSAEIISRYLAGEGRGLLGLRAKLPDSRIKEILTAAGISLRGRAEARVLFAPRASAQQRRQRQRRRGQC